MTRCVVVFSLLLSATLIGCGGVKELPPDSSKVQQVDPADIQRQIQEGMKMSGGTKQADFKPEK